MTNIHYFVVGAYVDDQGKTNFIVDDEVFMARFHDGGVWNEDTQEWQRPDDLVVDSTLAEKLAEKLAD